MNHTACYLKDYPRPQFMRKEWVNLNGIWNFMFDLQNKGEQEKWFVDFPLEARKITVPFSYNTELSGINENIKSESIWYSREVIFNNNDKTKRVLLNFEGSDYITKLWVNGAYIGVHEGGYTRFSFDITDVVEFGKSAIIVVKCEDKYDATQPRGKQKWMDEPFGCWYNETYGMWKSVWAEYACVSRINTVKITPDLNNYFIEFESDLNEFDEGLSLRTVISRKGTIVSDNLQQLKRKTINYKIDIHNDLGVFKLHYWTPDAPLLYDVEFILYKNDNTIDTVGSYFGVRQLCVENNMLILNSNPIYLRMVLNQGYYPFSGLSVPDEDSIIKDIKLIKELGFNGVRLHQKIEDERFLYYADILGLMVWVEMPSAYEFKTHTVDSLISQWSDVVKQFYNFPSVVAWVPMNESWGVPMIVNNSNQQSLANALYYLTKAYDKTRPVISNDGWEHTTSDIITLHNYSQSAEELGHFYNSLDAVLEGKYIVDYSQWRIPFSKGYKYKGQPIIISEFAGIGFKTGDNKGWGYGEMVQSQDAYVQRLRELVKALRKNDRICGFCITQLTDVEAEINGLLEINRNPKAEIAKLNAAITQK